MITSEITITCITQNQMAAIGSFVWPAGSKLGRVIPVSTIETKLENCCNEGSFENAVTGIAIHLAKHCPGVRFTIAAWLNDPENYYHETLNIEYDGSSIVVHLDTEDQMFKNGKICIDCGTDMTKVFDKSGFKCPQCGTSYMPAGHPDQRAADQIFGSDSCTYSIPHYEFNN